MGPNEITRKGRLFFEVPGDRKVPCIKTDNDSTCLLTDTRFSYCQNCCYGEQEALISNDFPDKWYTVNMAMFSQPSDEVTGNEPTPKAS